MTIEQFLEGELQSQARALGATIRLLADCRSGYNDTESLKQEIMNIIMETDNIITKATGVPDLYALADCDALADCE